MIQSKVLCRLFAGIWFAAAAVIPVAYFSARFQDGSPALFGDSPVLMDIIPILLSGVSGLLIGSSILDPEDIKNAGQAVLRGLMVSVLSYLLLFAIPMIFTIYRTGDPGGAFIFFIFMFLYGLLAVGWLAGAAGMAAGGLLFLLRLKISGDGKR